MDKTDVEKDKTDIEMDKTGVESSQNGTKMSFKLTLNCSLFENCIFFGQKIILKPPKRIARF